MVWKKAVGAIDRKALNSWIADLNGPPWLTFIERW